MIGTLVYFKYNDVQSLRCSHRPHDLIPLVTARIVTNDTILQHAGLLWIVATFLNDATLTHSHMCHCTVGQKCIATSATMHPKSSTLSRFSTLRGFKRISEAPILIETADSRPQFSSPKYSKAVGPSSASKSSPTPCELT